MPGVGTGNYQNAVMKAAFTKIELCESQEIIPIARNHAPLCRAASVRRESACTSFDKLRMTNVMAIRHPS
ncbi:MAG: hypothetical protein AB1442_16995 [Nitrospirota bacterium]